MKKFLIIFLFILSFLGLILSFFDMDFRNQAKAPKTKGHMEKIIPTSFGKFTSKDVPLSEDKNLAASIEGTLAVNEFFNREYTDGKRSFTIYISYWAEGKESTARAITHTPDRCWVLNGWKNVEEKRLSDEVLKINNKDLMPAYYREMTYDTGQGKILGRNIWFWYIADGKRYNFGTENHMETSLINYMKVTLFDAIYNSPESYFIRIDSSDDLRELFKDKDFQAILNALGELILYPKKGDLE